MIGLLARLLVLPRKAARYWVWNRQWPWVQNIAWPLCVAKSVFSALTLAAVPKLSSRSAISDRHIYTVALAHGCTTCIGTPVAASSGATAISRSLINDYDYRASVLLRRTAQTSKGPEYSGAL